MEGKEGGGKPGQEACNLPRAQIQGPERHCQNASSPQPLSAAAESPGVRSGGIQRAPPGTKNLRPGDTAASPAPVPAEDFDFGQRK